MELGEVSLPAVVQKRQGQGSYSGGVGMFQTLGRGQREVRTHLAGCALGGSIGGDIRAGFLGFLGGWKKSKCCLCVYDLFKHQNYTTHASRAQGMAAVNGGREF